MMKTKNINLLDLDNDILNIIGDYVIEDNIKNDCLRQWIEIYTKKIIIKDLEKEIAILKPNDTTGEKIGSLIYSKIYKTIFSEDEIYDFLSDRGLMLKRIEKGRCRCIFTRDEYLKRLRKEEEKERKKEEEELRYCRLFFTR